MKTPEQNPTPNPDAFEVCQDIVLDIIVLFLEREQEIDVKPAELDLNGPQQTPPLSENQGDSTPKADIQPDEDRKPLQRSEP